jgi:hypothetical protein
LDDWVTKPYHPKDIFDCMARHLHVSYDAGSAAMEPVAELRSNDLSHLSPEVRATLREALISLNVERIAQAVELAADSDPAAGAVLRRYTSQFAYTAILHAIDSGSQEWIPRDA